MAAKIETGNKKKRKEKRERREREREEDGESLGGFIEPRTAFASTILEMAAYARGLHQPERKSGP